MKSCTSRDRWTFQASYHDSKDSLAQPADPQSVGEFMAPKLAQLWGRPRLVGHVLRELRGWRRADLVGAMIAVFQSEPEACKTYRFRLPYYDGLS